MAPAGFTHWPLSEDPMGCANARHSNGCGKTSLLRVLTGEAESSEHEEHREVSGLDGVVFEEPIDREFSAGGM